MWKDGFTAYLKNNFLLFINIFNLIYNKSIFTLISLRLGYHSPFSYDALFFISQKGEVMAKKKETTKKEPPKKIICTSCGEERVEKEFGHLEIN